MAPQLDPETRARVVDVLDRIILREEARLRCGVLARRDDPMPDHGPSDGQLAHIGRVQQELHALRRTREQ